ncbi:class B sortase [Collinsella tanakaei]|uniref:class B sortase n=1 Tax=Collinsella tanakaei TaxID=626935 RepID=UPI001EF51231|nr:class B sortase [Collinsella tanakaei]
MAANGKHTSEGKQPASAFSGELGSIPAERMRMVPSGSHFSAQKHADDPVSSRPAGKRFAAPAASGQARAGHFRPADTLSAPDTTEVGERPAGKRFATTPKPQTVPGISADSADATERTPAPAPVTPAAPSVPTAASVPTPAVPAPAAQRIAADRIPAIGAASAPASAQSAVPSINAVPSPAASTSTLAPSGPAVPAPVPTPAQPIVVASAAVPSRQQPTVAAPAAAPVPQQPIAPAPSSYGTIPRGTPAPSQGAAPRIPRAGEAPVEPSPYDAKPRRRGSVLSTVLIVIGVILLIVAAVLLGRALLGYQQAQGTYTELQEEYAVSSDEGDGVPNVDFDALAAINPDIVGWIYIPGTVVNYPVVHTDDNTTYLDRLFDLSGNGSGTIFMDMDNTAPGMLDQQTTLYGHHMYDGSMLKIIDNTTNQAEFDKIETVYYITRTTTYVLKPIFTARVEDTYTDARKPNFTGADESLPAYLADLYTYAKAEAPDAEERLSSATRVMSLVTCAGEIIPRTTRAVMVLDMAEAVAR